MQRLTVRLPLLNGIGMARIHEVALFLDFQCSDLFVHFWLLSVPTVWRKTRLLTNDGMLKIHGLDVEEFR